MGKTADFILKHSKLIFLISMVVFIMALFIASKIGTDSSFEGMISENNTVYQSQIEYNKYFESDDLGILIIRGDSNEAYKFMAKFEKAINKINIDVNLVYKQNFDNLEEKALLYVDKEVYSNIDNLLREQPELFQNIQSEEDILKLLDIDLEKLSEPVYIENETKDAFLCYMKPNLNKDNYADERAKFVDEVKNISDNIKNENNYSLDIGLTGGAMIQDYEADLVMMDTVFGTALIALILIIIFIIISFRRLVLPLLSIYPLILGVIITAVIAYMIYGALNMFSLMFAALLFGLGIDFAVHILARYFEEKQKGKSLTEAIRNSLKETGIGIIIGASTSSVAFLTFTMAKFKAFNQIGVISGIGILLLALIMIFLMSSIIIIVDSRKNNYHKNKNVNYTNFYFLKLIGRFSTNRPIIIIILVVSLMIGLSYNITNIKITGNMLDIYPKQLDSLDYLKIVEEEFSYNANSINLLVDNYEQMVLLEEKLESNEHIKEVNTILDYLPKKQEYKINILKKLGEVSNNDNLKNIKPVEIYDLPENLKSMFIGKNDKFTVEISPKGNIYNKNVYDNIEKDVLKLTGRLPVGMPVLMLEVIELIRTDIINIVGFCIGIIFIFLIITFKKFKVALITIIPLLSSLYLTLLSIELFNIDLNIFSIIAFPIILGIGIDSSIHLEHRIVENRETIPYVILHTGKAVILTSMTTIFAFASLSFSSHRGINSIGLTVVLGMSISLINSLTLLPALNSIFKINKLKKQ